MPRSISNVSHSRYQIGVFEHFAFSTHSCADKYEYMTRIHHFMLKYIPKISALNFEIVAVS